MPTPQGGGENFEREVLEPIVVLRPRRTDALADLFRELTELSTEDTPGDEKTRTYEAVNVASAEPVTERLPPLPPRPAGRRRRP
ncbi:peptidoglycan-binding protein, partial [Streptomyces sp. S6]